MPQRNQDNGEDFEAEINAIESDESDDSDGSDEQSGSDLDQLRMVLAVPGADAQMHEVQKALAMAQQAYNATRSELRVLKRQYLTLSSAVPARSHCLNNRGSYINTCKNVMTPQLHWIRLLASPRLTRSTTFLLSW
ncbi:hypothetical protein F4604DRAFT_1943803 [Suillus subluteus]|nr:hypothetical protein F4604DRAFT_1943803 [Suillus subluteus]